MRYTGKEEDGDILYAALGTPPEDTVEAVVKRLLKMREDGIITGGRYARFKRMLRAEKAARISEARHFEMMVMPRFATGFLTPLEKDGQKFYIYKVLE